MIRFAQVVTRLSSTIASRRGGDPTVSWTAKLLADPKLAAKKMGEEAIEAILATSPDAFAAESADLIYHWLVLAESRGVNLDAVADKLEEREGKSGIEEKAGRG